jgi:type VI secretion system protein
MSPKAGEGGFLEKMLGPLPGSSDPREFLWVGDPIRCHLELLLNCRRGSHPIHNDYGLPDMTTFDTEYPASLGELRKYIENLIRKYEPRLSNVRVKVLETEPSEFRVALLISGEIEQEDGSSQRVRYKTTISSNGRAFLEGAVRS